MCAGVGWGEPRVPEPSRSRVARGTATECWSERAPGCRCHRWQRPVGTAGRALPLLSQGGRRRLVSTRPSAGRGAGARGRGEPATPGHPQQGRQPTGAALSAAWGLVLPQGGEREGQAGKRPEGV